LDVGQRGAQIGAQLCQYVDELMAGLLGRLGRDPPRPRRSSPRRTSATAATRVLVETPVSNEASGHDSLTPAGEVTGPRTGGTDGEGDRHGSAGLARLRDDTCGMLLALDNAAKARASIVRSCAETEGLPARELEALKDLLRSITDQRKRMRTVRRLWQSLSAFERPSAELIEATDLCFSECRELALALDPLRAATISQVQATLSVTWRRLLRTAAQFSTPGERLAHGASQELRVSYRGA
jgi:hypothetical protein